MRQAEYERGVDNDAKPRIRKPVTAEKGTHGRKKFCKKKAQKVKIGISKVKYGTCRGKNTLL